MENTKINLCDDCVHSIPECLATEIKFGDGVGNDNIIACADFQNDVTKNPPKRKRIGAIGADKVVTEIEKQEKTKQDGTDPAKK